VGLRWRQVSFSDLLTLLAFGALGGRYLRLTPLLFLTSAPLIARCLDEMEFLRSNRRMAAAVAVGGALLLSRVPVPALVRGLEVGGQALEPPDVFSEPAMRYAREHGLSGPAFTSINLGGYVAWKLYPTAFVFIDSRLQAYPPAHFLGVSRAALDRNAWDALTAGVDWAVLSVPRINPFSGTGRFDESAWATAYRDAAIEIIVRRHGRYGALARTD
jgi:hypothetical protein